MFVVYNCACEVVLLLFLCSWLSKNSSTALLGAPHRQPTVPQLVTSLPTTDPDEIEPLLGEWLVGMDVSLPVNDMISHTVTRNTNELTTFVLLFRSHFVHSISLCSWFDYAH